MGDSDIRMVSYSIVPRETTTLRPSQVHKGFVFAPRYRSPLRAADASTFQSRARTFCLRYGLPEPILFDNDGDNDSDHMGDSESLATRRAEIVAALDAGPRPLDVVAYFGHGARRGLSSAGFLGPTGLRQFAEAVARNANQRLVVVLNACQCGYPGAFAEQLYDELFHRGIRATIFAHHTSGHTTNNPYKRRYPGGDYLVEPNDPYFRQWRTKLWESDLWVRYPFMEPDELYRVIQS